MMKSVVLALISASVAYAFAPVSSRVTSSGLSMKLEGAAEGSVGSDIEFPEFDPFGLTRGISEEKYFWYRSAELKHGRVAMLAALGQVFTYKITLPDAVFNQAEKPFAALTQVLSERPLAATQIILAIFAVEALGQFRQVRPGAVPGDLGFDPLGLKPSDPELWEKTQLRELKNGRLAMLAIAGQLLAEYQTGFGPLEAWSAPGSPVNFF